MSKDKNRYIDCLIRLSCAVLILVLCFLMASPVYADDVQTTYPPGYEDLQEQTEINNYIMSYMIWMCLRVWGIQITYNDFWEWSEDVSNLIIEWVFEYLDDTPSIYSINEWIAPWQAGYDYWGNWSGNASLLEDVQDFANWLIDKFDLTSNAITEVNVVYSIDGYTLYKSNTYYYAVSVGDEQNPNWGNYGNVVNVRTDNTTSGQNPVPVDLYYFIWRNTAQMNNPSSAYGYRYVYISITDPPTVIANGYVLFEDGTERVVSGTSSLFGSGTNQAAQRYANGMYYCANTTPCSMWNASGQSGTFIVIPANAVVMLDTWANVQAFMENAVIDSSGMYIHTGMISLPDNDPEYTSGDSIKIVGTNPIYIEIEFPDTINVDNYPTVIIKPSVENPGFSGIWHYIQDWVQSTSETSEFVRYLFVDAPEPLVYLLWSIVGLALILGVIKIMRK